MKVRIAKTIIRSAHSAIPCGLAAVGFGGVNGRWRQGSALGLDNLPICDGNQTMELRSFLAQQLTSVFPELRLFTKLLPVAELDSVAALC